MICLTEWKGGVAAAIFPCPTMLLLSGYSFFMAWNHIPTSLKVPMSPYMIPRPYVLRSRCLTKKIWNHVTVEMTHHTMVQYGLVFGHKIMHFFIIFGVSECASK